MGLCGGCTQDDDIPGIVRFRTYEVLKEEVNNPKLRWAYLPYSMHMAGPREAIQHMIIRRNYGQPHTSSPSSVVVRRSGRTMLTTVVPACVLYVKFGSGMA